MLQLKSRTPNSYAQTGVLLLLASLSVSLLGFPRFAVGYFAAEPLMLALLAINLGSVLWLSYGVFKNHLNFSWPRKNLLANLWLAWLGWQVIITLFADLPIRSFLGPTEQGEGLAWYLMMSITILQAAAIWRKRACRTLILQFAYGIILFLAILHFMADRDNNLFSIWFTSPLTGAEAEAFMPFIWPDYLGYVVAYLWVAARLAEKNPSRVKLAAQTFISLFALLASSNRGAILLIGTAIVGSLLISAMRNRSSLFANSAAWKRLAMTTLLLPLAWLFTCAWTGFTVAYKSGLEQSIPTRVLLNHISLSAVASEPSRLLFGHGWGQYQDDFFKHALVRDISIYQNGSHNPNWQLVRGHNYHSHNMATETLLSLGLPGLILWLAMPIVILRNLRERYFWSAAPCFVAVVILQHWWFAMPQVMPFQALCWFLLMRQNACAEHKMILAKKPLLAVAAILCALLAWGGIRHYQGIAFTQKAIMPFANGGIISVEELKKDIPLGGDHLRSFVIRYTQRLATNQQAAQEKHAELFANFIEAAKALADNEHTGAYNAATIHYAYNVAITHLRSPLYNPIVGDALASYEHYALLHTQRAPGREDIIAPYLMALENNPKYENHLLDFSQKLLAINPAHRSALWLSGKILFRQEGYEKQGHEMMGAALKLGVQRIYGVKDSDVEKTLLGE